ncbi:hypothetical protein LV457_08700 [Mycobacterium sp. MYCO198283]|uniref:TPR repeat region-containing protein n=1 Tax=Mycobacterium sp. MYCO198283 TaxID=2883505 RepID=UPI001E2A5CBC|nr:hypothetical protein [Mycobacterium sp. MYCO198283]MCG5432372.1 hypothetical protein [Mycobacterium sp. MYCO198283]
MSPTRVLPRRLLATMLIAPVLAACAASTPPDLPGATDPTAVQQLLTSPDSASFLTGISTYAWPDDGARAGQAFAWIARDAASGDDETATRAGESAHALATYVAGHVDELTSVRYGFLGLLRSSVGAVNPALVRAWATALTPFQLAMVGDASPAPGFTALDPSDSYAALRQVFGIVFTDKQAGDDFARSAYDQAMALVEVAAREGCANPATAQAQRPRLWQAGALVGAVEGGATEPDAADVERLNFTQADNRLVLTIATACLPSDPDPIPEVRRYVVGSRLLLPDQIDPNKRVEYFTWLKGYAADRNINTGEFMQGYQAVVP